MTPSPGKITFIPLCEPHFGGREWEYVKECLDTGWVSSAGAFVKRFQEDMAAYLGGGLAVATVSGTAALHVALLVAGVEPGDEVLVSTLTFIAPANAVRYCGAWPVFMDAEPAHWQMDPVKVAEFLDKQCLWSGRELVNRATGRRVRAILPVHLLGHPVDMDPIMAAADKYGLAVIGDATQSLGAFYRGRPVPRLGHLGVLSFNGNKLMTTGGGGMIVTEREDWARRAAYLVDQAKDDPVEFIHQAVGFNYRLNNIAAALGCAQLERLGEHLAAKRRIVERYRQGLAGVEGITVMAEAPWAQSAWWLTTVLVDEKLYGLDCRQLRARLRQHGMESRTFYQPLHLSPAYQGCQAYYCEAAEWLWARGLSLPSSVGLNAERQDRVARSIRSFIEH